MRAYNITEKLTYFNDNFRNYEHKYNAQMFILAEHQCILNS